MTFNYEQSIWGKGTASVRWSDPTAFRLQQALEAVEKLPSGSKVLELGAGAGQFIRAVKKYRPDLDCYGSDISSEAIRLATDAHDGVHYALSSENTVPFADNGFDTVLIFDVLEHVENPRAIVSEVRRVLRPGGIFYAFVPCEGDTTSLWHALDMLHLKRDLTKKHAGHINYFTRAGLRTMIRESGFTEWRIRYSEHILGQLLGVMAFHLMDRATTRNGGEQINNEAYFAAHSKGAVSAIKKLVNTMVYIESVVLQWVPSPNVHLVVRK